MTPERLVEIRVDAERYAKHQRHGEFELSYAEETRMECDDFPKYVVELLAEVDALTAENATLKAQVEHYKLQSDQLCDRVEVLAAENATLRSKLAALVTAGEKVLRQEYDDNFDDPSVYGVFRSAVKSAKEWME